MKKLSDRPVIGKRNTVVRASFSDPLFDDRQLRPRVSGRPVTFPPPFEWIKAVVHASIDCDGVTTAGFTVTERKSGYRLDSGSTAAQAVAAAWQKLKRNGLETVRRVITERRIKK